MTDKIEMIEVNTQYKNHYYIEYFITLACNNRCEYCYVLDDLDNKLLFNEEVFYKTIEAFKEFSTPDVTLDIALFGGDPLLVGPRLIEFMEELKDYANFIIFSNFNYPPKSKNIKVLEEYVKDKSNVEFYVSWHESSDIEYVKQNILTFKDRAFVSLMCSNDTIDIMHEHYQWLKEQEIYNVNVKPIVGGEPLDFDNPKYLDIVNDSKFMEECKTFNGETVIGKELDDLRSIALTHMTICEVTSMKILYDGSITTICDYPMKGHIDTGIPKLGMKFCRHHCRCHLTNYRKVGKKYD